MVKIRTVYEHGVSPGFVSVSPSLTQQQFAEESDINYIVRRFNADGVYPSMNPVDESRRPMFGDFTNIPESPQEAYDFMIQAKNNFDLLPLDVRRRFNFDPGAFLDFASNPNNMDELVAMGLASKVDSVDNVNDNTPPAGSPSDDGE